MPETGMWTHVFTRAEEDNFLGSYSENIPSTTFSPGGRGPSSKKDERDGRAKKLGICLDEALPRRTKGRAATFAM